MAGNKDFGVKKLVATWKNTQSALGYRTLWDKFWKRLRTTSQQRNRRLGSTKPQAYGSLEPRQLLASAGLESNTLPTIDGLGAELVPQIEVQNQDSLSVDATSSAIQSWQRDGVVIDRASDLV